MAEITANFVLATQEVVQASFTLEETVPIDADFYVKQVYNLTPEEIEALDIVSEQGIPTKLSDLEDDSTHRVVTDTEKTTWNAKQPAGDYATNTALGLKVDKVTGKGLSTNDLTDILKSGYDTAVINTHTHSNKSALDGVSGSNTGDETATTIKTKLGITTLSGSNTGDQDLSSYALNSSLTTKADLVDGKVPASQLPAYVDDVIEVDTITSLPPTGEAGKIYITLDTNLTYRWTGSGYAEISASLALGETSATAYRGDRGKTAYDHSQINGNPHGTTKTDLGLGNVDNTSDADKPVSTATGTALGLKANDSAVVHNTGNESVGGIKTFTNDQNVGTAATGANQTVIATLDATEKFTSFTVAGNWTLTSGWGATNDGGTQLNHNAAGTTTALFLQNAPTIGKTYKVSITVNASVTGGFTVNYGSQITANINPVVSTPTTYDLYFTAASATNLTFTPITTARFVITAISIKEVAADSTGSLTVDKDIKLGGKIYHKNGTLGLQIAPNGAAVFGSSVTAVGIAAGGAISGITTAGLSGAATTTQTTTTTPVTGYVLTTAAALVGTPVRISPSVYWNGTAWNTTPTAASKANAIQAYMLPVSGAVTSGSLVFANATVDGVANTTELMRLGTNGNLSVGTTTSTSKLSVSGLVEYADNAAAVTAGLAVGAFYRTGDIVKVVH